MSATFVKMNIRQALQKSKDAKSNEEKIVALEEAIEAILEYVEEQERAERNASIGLRGDLF